jgi:hypothetical protein
MIPFLTPVTFDHTVIIRCCFADTFNSNAWNTISTTTICTENDLFDQPEKVDDGTDNKANKCSKQEPSGTLLTGSSLIRDITKKKYNLDSVPICVRGGVISDITAQLLQLPTDTSLKIILPLLMFASLSSSRGQRPDTTTFSQIDFETFTKFR